VRALLVRGRHAVRTIRTSPGPTPLAVDELISPLRYDVLVRARLFDAMQTAAALDDTFVGAIVEDSAYAVWFRKVAAARFHPALLADETAFQAALTKRVRDAMSLWASFRRQGFDPRHPIRVRVTVPRAGTATGKNVFRRFHLADGCHRLALLVSAGWRELPPSHYRVDPRVLPQPPDNTARLLAPLRVEEREYAGFLGRGYGVVDVDDIPGLLTALRDHRPESVGDVWRIVEVDIAHGLRVSTATRAFLFDQRGAFPQ
jgi:hypothetical protein